MDTISSLISMPKTSTQCKFLVENLMIPAYGQPNSKVVCEIVDPDSSWYQEILAYLHDKTIPLTLTPNQQKTFIHHTSH